ncbi:MAG: alpha/beta fold hydrolase [Ignavibacteriales bacterium]|nr:alpha/beta fold hydrolase [Ignavibacteriales bacterium]
MKHGIGILIVFFGTLLNAQEKTIEPEQRAREFVDLLAAGKFSDAPPLFDATMKTACPPATLEKIWTGLLQQVGQFKKQTGVRTEKKDGLDICFVTCVFERTTLAAEIAINASGEIAGLHFVPAESVVPYAQPEYARSEKYSEKNIFIGKGRTALPGTLTLPVGDGPFPAVVLVHGSGPNDRDESIGANKPFRDLALGLASKGIAVLRYEKRTRAHAAAMAAIKDSLTVKEETVDDAIAAVEVLSFSEKIDGKKIFIVGHSLGGMLVPRIMHEASGVAGGVVLAGATRPLEELILDQMIYLTSLEKDTTYDIVELKEQVARVKDRTLSPSTAANLLPLSLPAKYWLDLRRYDPVKTALQIKRPLLILQGGRDYQVTKADFDGWKNGLAARNDVRCILYPSLNHLFIAGEGKSRPEEYQQTGHVSEKVIDDIAQWITLAGR